MSKRKRYAAEEIIGKLREAEVHLAQGRRGELVLENAALRQQLAMYERRLSDRRSGAPAWEPESLLSPRPESGCGR